MATRCAGTSVSEHLDDLLANGKGKSMSKLLSEPQIWLMDYLAHRYGCTAVAEFQFHPTRKWRFDVALPYQRIAFEVDGGVWINGRHNRGGGSIKDKEKMNTAQALGWRVFAFTPRQVLAGKVKEFCEEYL